MEHGAGVLQGRLGFCRVGRHRGHPHPNLRGSNNGDPPPRLTAADYILLLVYMVRVTG